MQKYVTLATVELEGGVISLSELQADLRRSSLKKVGKGRYRILRPIQMKAGEFLGLTSLPKSLEYYFAAVPKEENHGRSGPD